MPRAYPGGHQPNTSPKGPFQKGLPSDHLGDPGASRGLLVSEGSGYTMLLWVFPVGGATFVGHIIAPLKGDVTYDHTSEPSMMKVHLRSSKCDQYGKGADVFVGKTGNALCPVAACLAYLTGPGHNGARRLRSEVESPATAETRLRIGAA